MTKTINDFLSPDDLMLAGPASDAPSDYWSKPAVEGNGEQRQGLTWDVVRATDNINKQAQQNFDHTNPWDYINPLKWGPAAGATLVEGVIDPLAQYARGEDVSRSDAVLAAAEVIPAVGAGARVAGQGAKQLYKSEFSKAFSNIPNYIKDFYSPNPVPGMLDAGKQMMVSSAKQLVSPEASTRYAEKGLSAKTVEVTRKNDVIINDTLADIRKTGEASEDQLNTLRHARKEDHGQIVYNGLIARQGGKPSPAAEKYMAEVYHTVEDTWDKQAFLNIEKRPNSQHISDQVMGDAFDLIGDTWLTPGIKKLKKGKSVHETGSILAVKKMRAGSHTGTHDRDVISSSAYNQLKDALIGNGREFQDTDEILAMLRKVEGPKYSIKKSDDGGVFVQFSPEMKSGYVEGGTNALIYIDKDRKMTFFVSDEHDMLGVVPPGFDRAITIVEPWTVDNFKLKTKEGTANPNLKKSRIDKAYDSVTNKKTQGSQYTKKAKEEQKKSLEEEAKQAVKDAEKKPVTKNKDGTTRVNDRMTIKQREAVQEIMAPVDPNYARFAKRRAAQLGILGAGIAYGTYENE